MDNAETNRGAQKSGPSWEFREARVWSKRRSIFVKGQKYGRNSDGEMCSCSQSPCSPFRNVLWESSTDGGPAGQAGWPLSPDCSCPMGLSHTPEFRGLGTAWQFIKDDHRQRGHLFSSIISHLSQQWLVHISI